MSAKKRPKVPRQLVAMFYRVKFWDSGCSDDYASKRDAVEDMKLARAGRIGRPWLDKLYRVIVWRKKG